MSERTCSIDGCEKPFKGRGWCDAHLWRWRKYGDPLGEAPPRQVRRGPRECSECGLVKNESEFYDRPDRPGRQSGAKMSNCKSCSVERASQYRREHPKTGKIWVAANRESCAAAQRRWRATPHGRETLRAVEARRDPEVRAAKAARRRARMMGVSTERVETAEVLRRHGRRCGICQRAIEAGAAIQIDHIVPLALGGEHTYANTQPAHAVCNQRKGARLLAELTWVPDQLMMPLE